MAMLASKHVWTPTSARKYVRSMLPGTKLKTVIFEEDSDKGPRTSPTTGELFVPAPKYNWTDEEFEEWFGYIVHELGHWTEECIGDLEYPMHNNIDMRSLYGSTLNVLSDFRNDNQWFSRDEIGAAAAVSICQTRAATRGLEQVKLSDTTKFDEATKYWMEVFSWYYQQKAVTMARLGPVAAEWGDLVSHDFDQYNDELHAMSCTDDVIALLNKIIKHAPEEHQPENQPQPGEGEGGDGEEGESGQQGSGGEAKDGESSDEEGEGKAEGGWISYRDMLLEHDHDAGEWNKTGAIGKIIYDHDPTHDYESHPESKVTYRHMRDVGVSSNTDFDRKLANQYAGSSKSLAAQTRRIIQIKTQSGWQQGTRRGKLSSRMLPRVPTGSKHVFKRKEQGIIAQDCVFYILGDWSGSMDYDRKRQHLIASFMMVNEALRPLNVRYEMAVFYDDYEVHNVVIKGFNERPSTDEIRELMCGKSWMTGGNADGESLEMAFDILIRQPEKKKVLIVLSDGQPASYSAGDAHTHLQTQVDKYSKYVTIYGIGLLSDSVKAYYPNHFIVNKASELEGCFINLLKENIL